MLGINFFTSNWAIHTFRVDFDSERSFTSCSSSGITSIVRQPFKDSQAFTNYEMNGIWWTTAILKGKCPIGKCHTNSKSRQWRAHKFQAHNNFVCVALGFMCACVLARVCTIWFCVCPSPTGKCHTNSNEQWRTNTNSRRKDLWLSYSYLNWSSMQVYFYT